MQVTSIPPPFSAQTWGNRENAYTDVRLWDMKDRRVQGPDLAMTKVKSAAQSKVFTVNRPNRAEVVSCDLNGSHQKYC